MSTQQTYINGFVKRAAEYGYNEYEAINILKAAELKGDQHKLDVDKDGKIEGEDLKKLRQRKQAADAAPQPTMNERINNALPKFLQNSNLKGTKVAPKGAYGNVLKAPTAPTTPAGS